MSFWSGEKLRQNLHAIIDVPTPDPKEIDCAAYTLHIGPEIYVTPHLEIRDPQSNTKRQIEVGEGFTIPPGQFAYLLTEEKITIPYNAIGFISVKATIKFKGLVNVSGFHVDPGWNARLIFSVYNAGPAPIHLTRGTPAFLIWIADLDCSALRSDAKDGSVPGSIPTNLMSIPPNLISNIPGEIHSLQSLSKRIDMLDKRLDSIQTQWRIYAVFGMLLITILLRGPIADEIGSLWKRAFPIPQQDSSEQIKSANPDSQRRTSK